MKRKVYRKAMRPRRRFVRRGRSAESFASVKRSLLVYPDSSGHVSGVGYHAEITLTPSEILALFMPLIAVRFAYERVRLRGFKVTFFGIQAVTSQTACALQSIATDMTGVPVPPTGGLSPTDVSGRPMTRVMLGSRYVSAYHNTLKASRLQRQDIWRTLSGSGMPLTSLGAGFGGIQHLYNAPLAVTAPSNADLGSHISPPRYKVTAYIEFSGKKTTLTTEV